MVRVSSVWLVASFAKDTERDRGRETHGPGSLPLCRSTIRSRLVVAQDQPQPAVKPDQWPAFESLGVVPDLKVVMVVGGSDQSMLVLATKVLVAMVL